MHPRPASPSPTPSASTTRSSDQNRDSTLSSTVLLPSTPSSASAMSRSRRPLSPTSLRDVDLSHDADMAQRKYPAPPTGHDLMALFPPAPPDNFPEMRAGPTSGYFQRQERAFFAQAGKEIVRVRVEVDVPHDLETDNGKARGREHRTWPQGHVQHGSHSHHQSPAQSSAAPPVLYPHPSSRMSRTVPVPVTPTSVFPTAAHAQSAPPLAGNPHPSTPHQSSLDPSAPSTKVEAASEDFRDDDEAWRRPMPYAERRRAGKHTRRVIVRN